MVRRTTLLALALAGAAAAPASAEVTVTNAGATEGGAVLFTVTRSTMLEAATASTVDGTATAATDYTALADQAVDFRGALTATVAVQTTADSLLEADETFTLQLTTSPLGTRPSATGTITNDDQPAPPPPAPELPKLSVADATTAEGDGANTVAQVPITLSAASSGQVTVQYATIDGTARSPSDYLTKTGTVTFAPGQTQAVAEVPIVSDEVVEKAEIVGVVIGNPQGATIGRAGGALTITDPDSAAPPVIRDDTPPSVKVTKPTISGRSVRVRVTCPKGELRCTGRVTLFNVADRKARSKRLRIERRLGGRSFTLAGGKAATVTLTLAKTIAGAARASGRLRVRAFVVTDDAAQNTDTTTRSATLRVRR